MDKYLLITPGSLDSTLTLTTGQIKQRLEQASVPHICWVTPVGRRNIISFIAISVDEILDRGKKTYVPSYWQTIKEQVQKNENVHSYAIINTIAKQAHAKLFSEAYNTEGTRSHWENSFTKKDSALAYELRDKFYVDQKKIQL